MRISSRQNAVEDTISYWDLAKNKDFSRYWRRLRRRKKTASIKISSRQLVAKLNGDYEWSCLMIDYPESTVKKVIEWGEKNIPEDALYIDEEDPTSSGREDHIHTTVCYGIGPEVSFEEIKSKCKLGKLDVSFGKIGKFEKDGFDVIKIDVESKDLSAIHEEIEDKIGAPGNTYPDYKPHVTIAYVKGGTCDDLIGTSPFEGEKFVIDKYDFSPATGNGKHIKHTASISDWFNKARMWYLKLRARNALKDTTNESLEASYAALSEAIAVAGNMTTIGPSDEFSGYKKEAINNFQELLDDVVKEMQRRGMGVQQLTGGKPYFISKKAGASNVPNPLRQNYDYSNEMCGPEWQNRVKCFEKRRKKRKSALDAIGMTRTSKVNVGDDFKWSTLGGKSYSGKVTEIDLESVYVDCTDGVNRCTGLSMSEMGLDTKGNKIE